MHAGTGSPGGRGRDPEGHSTWGRDGGPRRPRSAARPRGARVHGAHTAGRSLSPLRAAWPPSPPPDTGLPHGNPRGGKKGHYVPDLHIFLCSLSAGPCFVAGGAGSRVRACEPACPHTPEPAALPRLSWSPQRTRFLGTAAQPAAPLACPFGARGRCCCPLPPPPQQHPMQASPLGRARTRGPGWRPQHPAQGSPREDTQPLGMLGEATGTSASATCPCSKTEDPGSGPPKPRSLRPSHRVGKRVQATAPGPPGKRCTHAAAPTPSCVTLASSSEDLVTRLAARHPTVWLSPRRAWVSAPSESP